MQRTQISLTPEQAPLMRKAARRRGTSMAALIREAVDRTYGAVDDNGRTWDPARSARRSLSSCL